MHVRVEVSQMKIVLGTPGVKKEGDPKREGDIMLHETDRFIFEMRELSLLA